MNARIQTLKEHMLNEPRYASIEQAMIITQSYKEHEQESRILQRAYSLAAALEKLEIAIDPDELIVGNRTAGVRAGVVFPESGSSWVDREFETLPTRPQDTFEVNEEDIRTFRSDIKPYWEGKSLEDVLRASYGKEIDEIARVVKINQKDHAQGHICPDCKKWLAAGPAELKREAQESLAELKRDVLNGTADDTNSKQNQQDFYHSIIIVMDGVITFINRYARLAETMMDAEGVSDEQKKTLQQVAANCRNLAVRAPQNFHEALQSLWFLFTILHMESNASSFSPGRLDMILFPYYEKDIKENKLTKDEALELIECLWLKFNQIVYMRNQNSAKYFAGFPIGFNIAVGGVDRNGNNVENDLSYLFLKAQEELLLPQPNLSVRLHEGSTDELMKAAIKVVAKGSGMPQFFNDKAVIPSLEALGVTHKDALDYAIVGCVELTTQGNNLGWSDAAMFNLNKVLELAITGGKDLITGKQLTESRGTLAEYKSFEELEEAFKDILDMYMDKMILACEEVEKAHMALLPTPFLSSVIDNCMEKGMDVTAGGAVYNFSGIQMIQVANLADSFAAIKQLVFEKSVFQEQSFRWLWNIILKVMK